MKKLQMIIGVLIMNASWWGFSAVTECRPDEIFIFALICKYPHYFWPSFLSAFCVFFIGIFMFFDSLPNKAE